MTAEARPLPPNPVPDADTRPYWDGVAERRLLVQRCAGCGMWIWQPRPVCPRCHTADPVWTEVSGAGQVVSWTVVHPPVLPVWQDATPFVVVLVELDDAPGVRMVGQLVDDSGLRIEGDGTDLGLDFDRPVALRWRTDEAGRTLPAWTLVQ